MCCTSVQVVLASGRSLEGYWEDGLLEGQVTEVRENIGDFTALV